jgi:hypothetical protein
MYLIQSLIVLTMTDSVYKLSPRGLDEQCGITKKASEL